MTEQVLLRPQGTLDLHVIDANASSMKLQASWGRGAADSDPEQLFFWWHQKSGLGNVPELNEQNQSSGTVFSLCE